MSFCDAFVEFTSRLALTIFTSMIWVVFGEIIAAHQHGIMRRSRQLQRFLHLPTCTHIFSEADTEIHHDDIKFAAIALSFTTFFVSAGTLVILTEGPTSALSRPRVVCGLLALMVTPGSVLWLRLALTCRRRRRSRRAVAWDIEDASTDGPEMARDTGVNENTALLSSEREPKAGKADKVENDQLKEDGPSKEKVNTAENSSRGDGHSKWYATQVSWTDSELLYPVLL